MKATELMIGDWAMLGSEKFRVGTILRGGNYSALRPIPLTTEILAKNGFSYPKQSAWMKLDCPERQLWGCLHTDGALWLYASGDCDKDESFAEIRYVHELQHALRLCGIDKETTI